MASPEIHNEKVKEPLGFSERAKTVLEKLGFLFESGSFEDIYRLTSRDTNGGSYPYNAGFSSPEKIRRNWLIVKDGVEIGYYYTGLGKSEKLGRRVGEIGMIHLAPAIRDKNLSSPVCLLGYLQLLETGAEELRAVMGDETGKIEGLLKKIGFLPREERVGPFAHPVWKMIVDDREGKLTYFFQQFEERVARLNPSSLQVDPKEIDIDNPKRVLVKEILLARIRERGWWFEGAERVLFGYVDASILVYQENLRDGSTRLVLRVPGCDPKIFNKCLRTVFREELSIYPYPTDYEPAIRGWEVESPPLRTKKEVLKYAQNLALAGEEFFRKNSVLQGEALQGEEAKK